MKYSFPACPRVFTAHPDQPARLHDWTRHRDPASLPTLEYDKKYPQGELGLVQAIHGQNAVVLWTPDAFIFDAPAFRRHVPLADLMHVTTEPRI